MAVSGRYMQFISFGLLALQAFDSVAAIALGLVERFVDALK